MSEVWSSGQSQEQRRKLGYQMQSQRSSNVRVDRAEVFELSSGPVRHVQRGQGKEEGTARETQKTQPSNWKETKGVASGNCMKEVGSKMLSKIWTKN